MRIGTDLWKIVLFFSFLNCAISSNGQSTDTTLVNQFPSTFWTKQRFVPKVGASIQEKALVEVGVYWQNIYRHPITLASKGPYATMDIMIDEDNLLLGPKLGYEVTAGVLGLAFDVTYYYDMNYDTEGNNRRAFVGTPKAGLTLLGFADLFYGYQIPFSQQRIESLSRHRLSITFNINKDYFDLQNAPRKK